LGGDETQDIHTHLPDIGEGLLSTMNSDGEARVSLTSAVLAVVVPGIARDSPSANLISKAVVKGTSADDADIRRVLEDTYKIVLKAIRGSGAGEDGGQSSSIPVVYSGNRLRWTVDLIKVLGTLFHQVGPLVRKQTDVIRTELARRLNVCVGGQNIYSPIVRSRCLS